MSKSLSKRIASFDYFDKSLIVSSVTTGIISIASFATVIGAPVGIVSVIFSLAFSICTGVVKIFSKRTRNKVVMLARSILNSIESKVSEALINNEISHEDFMAIINEEILRIKRKHQNDEQSRSNVKKNILIEEGKKIGIIKLLSAMKLLITV